MRRLLQTSAVFLFSTLFLRAGNIPLSSCSLITPSNGAGGFTCNLYPSDVNGNFNGNNVVVPFPATWNSASDPITSGYVVLSNQPANIVTDINNFYGSSDSNEADWTQIIEFTDHNGQISAYGATQIILDNVGCNTLGSSDQSCYPAYSTLMATADFEVEPVNGIFVYDPCPGCSTSHVYTANLITGNSTVPEPATFVFAAGGFALLAGLRKFARQYSA